MADVPAYIDGRSVSLFVYDLSMDGCMIQAKSLKVREGQVIVLGFDERCTAVGTVLWRRNLTAGVRFETRLEPEAVARLLEAAAESPYAQEAFPRIDRSVLKVDNRKIDPPRF